jgi:hypothetical protein
MMALRRTVLLTSVSEPAVNLFSSLLLAQLTFSTEFAQGKVDPVEAGKQGGKTSSTSGGNIGSSGDDYKPTEHGGLKKDDTPDGRVKN